MDPASVIGLSSAILGIVTANTKSVKSLSDMRARYQITDLKVNLLIGHLSTLKAALNNVADLACGSSAAATHKQLASDLSVFLKCCDELVFVLDERVSALQRNEANGLSNSSKFNLLWHDPEMNEYFEMLNNQMNALNLLLTSLQCRTIFEQHDLLQSDESRRIFSQVKDDTSSLLWLRDSESSGTSRSAWTQDLSAIKTIFDFDREVFTSKVYRMATRSNMVNAIWADARSILSISTMGARQSRLGRYITNGFEVTLDNDAATTTSTVKPGAQTDATGQQREETLKLPIIIHSRQSLHPRLATTGQRQTSWFKAESVSSSQRRTPNRQRNVYMTPVREPNHITGAGSRKPEKVMRVLLAGISASGKSTLVKAIMAKLDQYDTKHRLMCRPVILSHASRCVLKLVGLLRDARVDTVLRYFNNYTLEEVVGELENRGELLIELEIWNSSEIRTMVAQEMVKCNDPEFME
ncbi:Uu.00g130800.m01.CDS01 [Anthostomella pinea]|uniref:Uu.00g130800.m01.CDS01 n=1 Tax=Anthostomella pinea TaxID=933095 RepID=A0AAI8YI80_9PEZI|nr:Uu.00g130800.m01.CDS01 [Anthostomella pinea]